MGDGGGGGLVNEGEGWEEIRRADFSSYFSSCFFFFALRFAVSPPHFVIPDECSVNRRGMSPVSGEWGGRRRREKWR